MQIQFSKDDLTAVFKQLLKLAKVRRSSKGVMILIQSTGKDVFLSLNGVQQKVTPLVVSGRGELHLPLKLFENLVDTMSGQGFTMDCNKTIAKVLQGRSVLTLPASVFREEFEEATLKKEKKIEKDFQRAKRKLIDNMGGADRVVYLDDSNSMKSGIVTNRFKKDGKDKFLVADEHRNIFEIFASQVVHAQRADIPLSDMWKVKIVIPLKFES